MALSSDILYTISFRRYLRKRRLDYIPDALLPVFADLERQRQRQGFIRAFVVDPHYLFPTLLASYLNYLDTLTCWTLTERPKTFVNLDHSLTHTLVADRNRLEALRFARLLDSQKSRVYLTSSRRPEHARGKTFARAILLNTHRYSRGSFHRLLTTTLGPIDPVPGSLLIIHANTLHRRAWLRAYAASRPQWWLTFLPDHKQSLHIQSPPSKRSDVPWCVRHPHHCAPPNLPTAPYPSPRFNRFRRFIHTPSALDQPLALDALQHPPGFPLQPLPKTPSLAVAASAPHHPAA